MNKTHTCDLYAVLGFVIGLGLFVTVTVFVLMEHNGTLEDNFVLIWMIILPASFVVGSMFSGYFCQPYISKFSLIIFVSPGPYFFICAALFTCGSVITGKGSLDFWLPIWKFLAVFISSSIVGAYFGGYLRAKQII
jgi:hypothetical protein